MGYQFSENIQRGILCLLKSNKDFYLQATPLIKTEYFEFPVHGSLYSIIKGHYEKYNALPTDDIILEYAKKVTSKNITKSDFEDELEYINNLDSSAISTTEFYVDLVEAFARKEAMKLAIAESIQLVKEDRIDEVESLVRSALLIQKNVNTGHNFFSDYKSRWDRMFNTEKTPKHKVVFPALNLPLEGGLGRKELAMVVAPPGVGKSIFLVNQGVEELKNGYNVLHITCEMSEDRVANRYDSVISLIPQIQLKKQSTAVPLHERLNIFQTEFKSRLIIKEFPTSVGNVNHIRALLVQLANYEDFRPDVIVVDYLELLRSSRELQQEYLEQQRIAEELRGLAMEHDCLVWTATQTNRLGRNVSVITDTELGDSYGKIRTVDYAVSLNQTIEEFENGQMRCYVMKSRNGAARQTLPVKINYSTLVMKEDSGNAHKANDE